MATEGPNYPTNGSTTAESPYDDNAWSDAGYIVSDDGNSASITAANFDTDDYSQVLKAYGFDFSAIGDGATIDGVEVEVNCWYANGAADIVLVQLLDTSRAKTGDNKASTPVNLTTSNATIETFGGSADKWGLSLTPAWLKDADFGVAFAVRATADNADVFVDYIRITVTYTDTVSVDLDALTLASAVLGAGVSPGAVSVDLDALALVAAALSLTVSAGGGPVSVDLDALTLASAVLGAGVSPGAVGVDLDAIALASAVLGASVSPGAVSVDLDALALASAVLALTVDASGAVSVDLDALTLASAVLGAGVSPGAVSVDLDALALASAVLGSSVSPGAVGVDLDALALASAALGAGVSPGAVSVDLDALTLASAVLALSLAEFVPSTGRTMRVHADGRGGATGEASRTLVVPARNGGA